MNLPVPIISPFQSISPLYSHYIPILSFIGYLYPFIPNIAWDQLIREAIALEPETDESRHWAGLGNTSTAAKDSEIYEISGESHV